MMTLADIQKNAEGIVSTFVDDATPAGHFGATSKIVGITTTYLLEGQKDDPNAVVKGRVIIIKSPGGSLNAIGYSGSGLMGGSYLGPVKSYAETFARMV